MLKVHHIGYAVKRMDRAIPVMQKLGYTVGPVIHDEMRKIDISFCEFDGYRVELVAPAGMDSPVQGILKSVGNTPYHICYTSDNYEEDLRNLTTVGCKIIVEPMEAVAFQGKKVCFLYSLGIGTIELAES